MGVDSVATPNKRKSFNNQKNIGTPNPKSKTPNKSPFNNKNNASPSPKKPVQNKTPAKTPNKTPARTAFTPTINFVKGSPDNKTPKMQTGNADKTNPQSNKKRPFVGNQNNSPNSPKKPKLTPFKGVAQMNKNESSPNKKTPLKKNQQLQSAKKQMQSNKVDNKSKKTSIGAQVKTKIAKQKIMPKNASESSYGLEQVKAKIEEIEKRGSLSKRGKRMARYFKKLERLLEGRGPASQTNSAGNFVLLKKQQNASTNKKAANQKSAKDSKVVKKMDIPDSPESPDEEEGIPDSPENPDEKEDIPDSPESPDEEEDIPDSPESPDEEEAIPDSPESPDEEEDDDDSDYDVETTIKADKVTKKLNDSAESPNDDDDDDEEDDSEDDDDDDDSGDDDKDNQQTQKVNLVKVANNKAPQKKNQDSVKSLLNDSSNQKNKTRYVLFVGNIAYDTEKDDLVEHFKKAAEIINVRIPLDQTTNKPRGFAYVEVKDEESYQKVLSMHNTFLKGRRINVLYTQGGKKKGEDKKKEIKAKNMKLQAMRKQGLLAGSKPDAKKRSNQRAKARNQKKTDG